MFLGNELNVGLVVDAIWAGFWGILFRKFFWDFIGGHLVAPAPGAGLFSGGMM